MFVIPLNPRATIELLRERGHEVTVRQQRTGSLRYRVDQRREWTALQMSRFFARTYEARS